MFIIEEIKFIDMADKPDEDVIIKEGEEGGEINKGGVIDGGFIGDIVVIMRGGVRGGVKVMKEVIKEEVEIENFGDFGEINEVGYRGDIGGVVIRKGEGDSVPNGVNFIKDEVVDTG